MKAVKKSTTKHLKESFVVIVVRLITAPRGLFDQVGNRCDLESKSAVGLCCRDRVHKAGLEKGDWMDTCELVLQVEDFSDFIKNVFNPYNLSV